VGVSIFSPYGGDGSLSPYPLKKYNGLYYPYMEISAYIIESLFGESANLDTGTSPSSSTSTVSGSLDGIPFTMGFNGYVNPSLPNDTISGTLVLTSQDLRS
jgi:hypothetical protein